MKPKKDKPIKKGKPVKKTKGYLKEHVSSIIGLLVILSIIAVIVMVFMQMEVRPVRQKAYGITSEKYSSVYKSKIEEGNKNYIEYKDFLGLIETEQVQRVIYGSDKFLYFYKTFDNTKDILRNGNTTQNDSGENNILYSTSVSYDTELNNILTTKGIVVAHDSSTEIMRAYINTGTNALGTLGFLFVYLIILVSVFSAFKADDTPKETDLIPDTKLSDVVGIEDVKNDISSILTYLKDKKSFNNIGATAPKGILLTGPPGVGKTMLAKAIAAEAGVPFYERSGSDFDQMFVGLGSSRIRTLFKQLRKHEKAILFIDEIDTLCPDRSKAMRTYDNQTINSFLKEMDGFQARDGIIVIGATNRPEDLDKAALRPGRFDRQIGMSLPNKSERMKLIVNYLGKTKCNPNINIESLAGQTSGCSGADIAGIINEAAFIAATRLQEQIELLDINDALYKILTKGNKRVGKHFSDEERKIVAYHEAGHALVSRLICGNYVNQVTILPSTSGVGGFTSDQPDVESHLLSKKYIENRVMCLYAGRCAELVLANGDYDEVTSGASNDISQATGLIQAMISTYGMDPNSGMLNLTMFKDADILTSAKIIAIDLYNLTEKYIKFNEKTIATLAQALLDKETINGDDVDKIIFATNPY